MSDSILDNKPSFESIPKSQGNIFSRYGKLTVWLFICVFLCMLVFTCVSPILRDDFVYSFSFATGERITSIADIFPSMAVHRATVNGRTFPHFLVQFFLMLPKVVFNIFNACIAVLVLWLLCDMALPRSGEIKKGKTSFFVLLSIIMLWCFLPAFGNTCLWLDGSINYSWSACLQLLLIRPFVKTYSDDTLSFSKLGKVLFALLAFVAGAYSENGSCSAIFIIFCLLVLTYIRRKKLPVHLCVCFVLACLGFLYMMSSPSELGTRAGSFDLNSVYKSLVNVIQSTWTILKNLIMLYCACLALAICAKVDKRRILVSVVLFLGALVSVFVFSLAAYFAFRSMFMMSIYTLVATMMLFSDIWDAGMQKPVAAFTGVIAAIFIMNFVLGSLDILWVYRASQARAQVIAQAQSDGVTDLQLERYSGSTSYNAGAGLGDISDYPNDWPNEYIADYYGFDSISAILTPDS